MTNLILAVSAGDVGAATLPTDTFNLRPLNGSTALMIGVKVHTSGVARPTFQGGQNV